MNEVVEVWFLEETIYVWDTNIGQTILRAQIYEANLSKTN